MIKIITLALFLFAGALQASQILLISELRAPNQNGSNPDIFTNMEKVPSAATGTFSAILDTDSKLLTNIS